MEGKPIRQAAAVANAMSVPSSALIFDAKGLSVATVDANNKVQVKPVTLNRDLGSVVEIATGLLANDQVIQNPPDGIANGDVVKVIAPQAAPGAPGATPPTPAGNHG